jgi:hypothetical protein
VIEVRQDLWTVEADVRCVTTNGTVTPEGLNVMGGGCAREAAERYPLAPRQLGRLLAVHGNHVYLLDGGLVSFPTKEDVWDNSTIETVRRSVVELETLTDLYGWQNVALPRPGCGLGGLFWDDVFPLVNELDDRFILVDFPTSPAVA